METEREVDPEARRVDTWFVPDAACAASLSQLGLFGRMCAQPTAIEAFSDAPDRYDLRDCAFKQLGILHLEGGRHPELAEPWMWVTCGARPSEGLAAMKCEPAREFPPGVYLGPSLFRMGIVVVSELPITRDTLLVRLLGKDSMFEQALRELKELPWDAPERKKILPMMRRYCMDTEKNRVEGCAEEEDWRVVMDFFEELRAEGHSLGLSQGLERGLSQGLERGLSQGLERGLSQGLGQGLIAALVTRFGMLPADLRAAIREIQDPRTLRECFRFVGAGSAEEALAGLRARLKPLRPR